MNNLTDTEIDAVLWAVSNHAQANANDIDAMMSEGMSRDQAKALNSAERKLRKHMGYSYAKKEVPA